MTKNLLPAILLLFSFNLLITSANATHIMGGDLTYQCLGGDTFVIQVNFFRDCTGVSAGTTGPIALSSTNCGISANWNLPQTAISGNDITPLCAGQTSQCGSNPTFPYGVQFYQYRDTIVLPQPNNCNDLRFSFYTSARNTTDNLVGQPGMYIFADLNNTDTCNSSPQFLNNPVPFVCAGALTSYNHGVTDPDDGDSLVFSLSPCFGSAGSPVNYQTGYSYDNPLLTIGPMTIDSATGTIQFTASTAQVGVVCVKVEEYRHGVKIGETIRDIQITVLGNCSNNTPTATGYNGSNTYDTAICPGQTINFDIFTFDADVGQAITLNFVNNFPPSATVTIVPGNFPIINIQWTPTQADLGFHVSTAELRDNACPLFGLNYYTYAITVRNPDIDLGPDTAICLGDTIKINPFTSVDFNSFAWLPNSGVSNPNTKNPDVFPSVTTIYTVTASNGFCQDVDTIEVRVESIPTVSVSPTADSICIGDSTSVVATGDPFSYSWSPGIGLSDPNIPNPLVFPTQSTEYTLTNSTPAGCSAEAIYNVTVLSLPEIAIDDTVRVCRNGLKSISANGTPIDYIWTPASYFFNGNTGANVSVIGSVDTTLTVTGTDVNGCVNSRDFRLDVLPLPAVQALKDTSIKIRESATIYSGTSAVSYAWAPGGSTDSSLVVEPTETTVYTLTITDANGCSSIDSVTITVLYAGNIFMPNAFSPNSDNQNDEFYVLETGALDLEFFRIYNRWGEMIFEGNLAGPGHGWDGTYKGKRMPVGVYTYAVKAVVVGTNQELEQSGNVTLLR